MYISLLSTSLQTTLTTPSADLWLKFMIIPSAIYCLRCTLRLATLLAPLFREPLPTFFPKIVLSCFIIMSYNNQSYPVSSPTLVLESTTSRSSILTAVLLQRATLPRIFLPWLLTTTISQSHPRLSLCKLVLPFIPCQRPHEARPIPGQPLLK